MASRAGLVIFWLAVACCVVAQGAIVRAALRARARAGTGGGAGGARRAPGAAELAWTVLPAIGLALVLALTWRAL